MFTLLLLPMVVACSATGDYEATIEEVPVYDAGESSLISILITDNEEAAAGLSASAFLEMSQMDHGVIEVQFDDQGNGLYESDVALPMGGEWLVTITITDGDHVAEDVLLFEVDEK
ncbi:FixH family protein [Desertibacillus haloalkaliphilus]|nr:FixH family protein [Desertibacillus haloalkaliphilus]